MSNSLAIKACDHRFDNLNFFKSTLAFSIRDPHELQNDAIGLAVKKLSSFPHSLQQYLVLFWEATFFLMLAITPSLTPGSSAYE